ncbi:hypothetical protein Pla52o_58110 [Novipirellula galeiformis]|uniref:Uncharacterized protein n=1 Tax=Novipirellula galeiformis TaxID=2528004 RepID=A0A5C6BDU8_9BACT|nr:hypothetical protein Pla52o_58110 [Novipirellula galeiformis]
MVQWSIDVRDPDVRMKSVVGQSVTTFTVGLTRYLGFRWKWFGE